MAAKAFYDAADLVWNTGDLSRFAAPVIMNYAFSAELSLKATETRLKQTPMSGFGLIPVATIESEVRGHDLYRLFFGLTPSTRSELESNFEAGTGLELVPLLARCARYFEESRYLYEKKGGSLDFGNVRTLASGLLDAVLKFGREPQTVK